jgi:hypothetical protein
LTFEHERSQSIKISFGDDEVGSGVAEEFGRIAGDGAAGHDDLGVRQRGVTPPGANLAEGFAFGGAGDGAAVENEDVWRLTLVRESTSSGLELRGKVGLLRLVQAASESFERDGHKG